MTATLQTDFVGIKMPNPFMLASAPPSTSAEQIARSFERGWGGAVIKTVQYSPRWIKQNVNPRIHAIKNKSQIMGFTNFEIGSQKTLDEWAHSISWLKQRFPEHGVLASLMHTDVLKEEEWRETTRILDDAGADGFELNLSCSHGQAESGCGAMLGADEEKIRMVVSWVREETLKPVIPKLTALTMNVQAKGLAAKAGGADAITAINTIRSIPGVDLKTFVPYNIVDGRSAPQGLSGKAIKPIALGCVMQLAMATKLPISATGGVYNWRDAAEFISLGAQTIQVCSAVMENGYGIIDGLTAGLLNYMETMSFECVDSFRGKALPHIAKQIDLSREYKIRADVDDKKCIGCGKCVVSCLDSGYAAMRMEGKSAMCDADKCDGCGLCSYVCPQECISLIKK